MTERDGALDAERFEGVYLDQLARIFWLLRDKLPRVFAANRLFEERTGFHNQSGTNNLVDALSHIGTLVEYAERLDQDGQAEQVAHFEDHLRRSMMEAFEQLVKLYLGKTAELWDRHTREVRPLILSGDVVGLASIDELEALRVDVRELLDRGRQTKRAPGWTEWDQGTDYFIRACDAVDLLRQRLEEGLAAAERARGLSRATRVQLAGISLAALIGATIALALDRVL